MNLPRKYSLTLLPLDGKTRAEADSAAKLYQHIFQHGMSVQIYTC